MSTPKREAPYLILDAFAGKWKTSGTMKTDQGELKISGSDTYEWLPGGYALLHQVDVTMGDQPQHSIEVIGYDLKNEWYTMQSFNTQGEASNMTALENAGTWKFVSKDLRFTGSFSADKQIISGQWETMTNGNWQHLMEIRLTRIKD